MLTTEQKNNALIKMAESLVANCQNILEANKKDIAEATHLSPVMQDRLLLTAERVTAMADGIRQVALLPDPVGKVLNTYTHQNGMKICKISVPFGVVAVIFESRPNVAADTAALTLKSGNVCVLRGGKESYNSCTQIVASLKNGLKNAGLPEDYINYIEDRSRESANMLMTANGYVDLLIPRGGAGLIKACVNNATVPCIETGTGICHIYIDEFANLEKALNIVENAKTSRPSVCNAQEVCLVNKSVAKEFLPKLKERLVGARINNGLKPVELRLCEQSLNIIDGTPASDTDFDTEFLDYILAVKIVDNAYDAIKHIQAHSTHHSEAIITENEQNANLFITLIDSAAVYVNASTRFTDGGEFGGGAEIGISTQKLHARGPMGLNELTTYKYVIRGNGQTR
ncbi:MAG: glutamate-5-semialdehyde dehydrogenase [Clostridia bacterium]|nr:glutamate-5-semialdehyde dehydrogenase [Clostridia bacterium]